MNNEPFMDDIDSSVTQAASSGTHTSIRESASDYEITRSKTRAVTEQPPEGTTFFSEGHATSDQRRVART